MLALLTKVRGGIPRGQAGRDELVDAFHAPVRLPGVARPYV